MSNEREQGPPPGQPMVYQIRLRGHLGSQWAERFGGLSIALEDNGDTLLTGPVIDQAALHGLLRAVRDLGLPLVSISQAESDREGNMNAIGRIANKTDARALLSTLWIVVMISMLKADILSLYIPGAADEVARTAASVGIPVAQLMLFGAVMGVLSTVMIVLSRVLKHGISRWLNILAGIVTIVYVWGGAASFPHYTFIAVVETICLLFIIWTALTWRSVEA